MLKYNKLTTEYLSPIDEDNSGWIPWQVDKVLDSEYKSFWKNITDDEKKLIDSMNNELREKMKWILTFSDESISLVIDWNNLVFNKEQIISWRISWYDWTIKLGVNNKRLLSYNENEKIKKLFKWNLELLDKILFNSYLDSWTSTELSHSEDDDDELFYAYIIHSWCSDRKLAKSYEFKMLHIENEY